MRTLNQPKYVSQRLKHDARERGLVVLRRNKGIMGKVEYRVRPPEGNEKPGDLIDEATA
ncbi:protein of unknown function (plasmid) [Rhodovastum atsumiense]|nr:protein of unknown function [Rhodovastum atsumiense]